MQEIIVSDIHREALKFCTHRRLRNNILFVSGKPGTGKSVLIKYLDKKLKAKGYIVSKSAPTGAAAINIKGQTIHSLFGIKTSIHNPFLTFINKYQKELLSRIDVFIIDEISMVRADILDEIDTKLRAATGIDAPFGGKVMILCGDLFQIDPILTDDEEPIFYGLLNYENKYFFSSRVIKDNDYKVLLLNHIYRQDDDLLKEILNNIRVGKKIEYSLNYLNENCYGENGEKGTIKRDVTITTINKIAQNINEKRLSEIDDKLHTFKAIKSANWKTKILTPEILEIKTGAQVMITLNNSDKGYLNGDICKVGLITRDTIYVERLIDSKTIPIRREKFTSTRVKISGSTIIEEEAEEFTQFPLTLGWAFSIHKAQGMTIPSIAIDLGKGAFTSGQLYVALSRMVNIKGLSLIRPIYEKDVIINRDAINFYRSLNESQFLVDPHEKELNPEKETI